MAKARETGVVPQEGPQTTFWNTQADIAIYGGSAGGGKSWAILAEPTKHQDVPGFGCVVFRRTFAQITQQGGLWEKSDEIYAPLGARPIKSAPLKWVFPGGGEVQFGHLQYEADKYNYQGAEIALIGFDELTHFTESQFFYLLSRNRSTCGIKPYVRASCNPDADSWVAKFLAWWIDQETGFPIPERAGVLRYMARDGDTLIWGDSRDEVYAQAPHVFDRSLGDGATLEDLIKSVTFIPASLEDNKILQAKDPTYRANLMLQDRVERERLLGGNWKIRATAGMYFKRSYFGIVDTLPNDIVAWVRYWDRAGTEEEAAKRAKKGQDPDYTVGVLMGKTRSGRFVVADVERFRGGPTEVEASIKRTTRRDAEAYGDLYHVGIEQDPGQAGKFEANYYVRELAGYVVRLYPARQNKETRAKPFSAQAEAGNVVLLRGHWNDPYLQELETFPLGGHDDQVDGSSGAFAALTRKEELHFA